MTSSHLHMSPSANWHKSTGPVSPEPRVADGPAVHLRPLSPLPGSVSCHASL